MVIRSDMPMGVTMDDARTTVFLPMRSQMSANRMLPMEKLKKVMAPRKPTM